MTWFIGILAATIFVAYANGANDNFGGKGLVPDTFVGNPAFMVAVIFGAAITVFVAAKTGIPISTTHSLTGALVGAGFIAIGVNLGFSTLEWKVIGGIVGAWVLTLPAAALLSGAIYWVIK